MTESQIVTVTTFFFYALMDEKAALTATKRTLSDCRKVAPKKQNLDDDKFFDIFIKQSREHYLKLIKRTATGTAGLPSHKGWLERAPQNLGPWKQFHRSSPSEEILMVIWNRILGISLTTIAKSLNISEGTASYRVGNALKKLGSMHGDLSDA